MKRPNWNEYLMLLAFSASLRSEDPNRKVGCVCVDKGHRVLATGYNGLLPGKTVSEDYWNSDIRLKTIFCAEPNGLLLCRPKEVHKLVVTTMCCLSCLKLAACHGVKEIVYCVEYPKAPESVQLATEFHNMTVTQVPFSKIKSMMKDILTIKY